MNSKMNMHDIEKKITSRIIFYERPSFVNYLYAEIDSIIYMEMDIY